MLEAGKRHFGFELALPLLGVKRDRRAYGYGKPWAFGKRAVSSASGQYLPLPLQNKIVESPGAWKSM